MNLSSLFTGVGTVGVISDFFWRFIADFSKNFKTILTTVTIKKIGMIIEKIMFDMILLQKLLEVEIFPPLTGKAVKFLIRRLGASQKFH